MKITDVFEEKHLEFIQDLIYNEKYEVLRVWVNHLLKTDDREFAFHFDYILAKTLIFPISGIDPNNNAEVEDANELYFLYYLQYKITRAIYILEAYSEHAYENKKPISEELEETLEGYFYKDQFLQLKMKKVVSKEALRTIENTLQKLEKPKNGSQQNTLNGKKLNLLERYEIARRIFNIDSQIRTLLISEAEKDKLLSIILDCNTTNARHIMNGKYPGKIREELISGYIQTLKK